MFKKIINLILCAVILFGLSGCGNDVIDKNNDNSNINSAEKENSKKEYILELNKMYELKDSKSYGLAVSEITLNDNGEVKEGTCGIDSGCTTYKGTYEIKENKLIIKLTTYQDVTGEWIKLSEEYQDEDVYDIIDNNIFVKNDGTSKLEYTIAN